MSIFRKSFLTFSKCEIFIFSLKFPMLLFFVSEFFVGFASIFPFNSQVTTLKCRLCSGGNNESYCWQCAKARTDAIVKHSL